MFIDLTNDLGLESHQETSPQQRVDGADMDLSAISFETAVAAEVELFEAEIKVEVVASSLEQLNTLSSDLESTLENGGLKTPVEQAMFQRLFESATGPFGAAVTSVPSLEAFDAEGAAEIETRASLEVIKENAKKVADWAAKMLDKAIALVTKLVRQYLTLGGRNRATLGKLKEALKAATGSPEGEVEVSKYVSEADVAKATKYAKDVASDKDITGALSTIGEAIKAYDAEKKEESLEKIKEAKANLAVVVKGTYEANTEATEEEAKIAGFTADGYEGVFKSSEIAAGVHVVVAVPKDASSLNVGLKVVALKKDVEGGKAKALDVTAAGKLIDDLVRATDVHDAVVSVMDKQVAATKDLVKALKGEISESDDKRAIAFLKDIKTLSKVAYVGHQGVAKELAKIVSGQANYIKASIGTMKTKKDEK